MQMPAPEAAILAQREAVLAELPGYLAPDQVIADGSGPRAYDSDALTAYRQAPLVAARAAPHGGAEPRVRPARGQAERHD